MTFNVQFTGLQYNSIYKHFKIIPYMSDFSLGIAMIVKNGADTLDGALKSIRGIADQIVVVDTGSSDDSPAIASRLGAELHYFKWQDDFSVARNYSLTKMRTDWILMLDADEELADFEKLKEFVDDQIGGIRVKILNQMQGGKSVYSHRYTRFFRNHPGIRFEGKIHEQINESIIAAGFEIIDSDIKILHSGYSENSPEKIERNRDLLQKELESNPEDSWIMFHLAETEFSDKNHSESKELFIKALSKNELSTEQIEKSRIRLAQIAIAEDQFELIEDILDFRSENMEIEGFRKYILSSAYLLTERYSDAAQLINDPDVNSSMMVDKTNLEKARTILSNYLD
jgi:glycosyltransferase involved in cell wall biosynthesis